MPEEALWYKTKPCSVCLEFTQYEVNGELLYLSWEVLLGFSMGLLIFSEWEWIEESRYRGKNEPELN